MRGTQRARPLGTGAPEQRIWRTTMPEKRTIEKARKDKRAGKAPTTQAGEFVREEVRKIRRGEHGARSPEQAIAIGLSKARRAGVGLAPPKKGRVKERTRRSAEYAYEAGQHKRKTRRRPRVARAVSRVLEREPHLERPQRAPWPTTREPQLGYREQARSRGLTPPGRRARRRPRAASP